mmetsp:Transcript_14565/g.32557  ORF Transcript_14565/g.32557 Transcript_14565/m.32557 type:complete len:437 (-) Transcript_14565:8-1318(-)
MGRKLGRALLSLDHAVGHEIARERPVHALEGDNLADDLPPDPGALGQALPDHDPGVEHPHPDRVPPGSDGLLDPVLALDFLESVGAIADAFVLLVGDEVGMRPFLVQEVEFLLLDGGDGVRLARLSLAPCRDHQSPARLEDARHFLHVLSLVGHVFATLAAPHQIERVVGELHLQRIHNLEVGIVEAPVFGQLPRSLHLLGREGDASDGRAGVLELGGKVARCPANPAPNVQHLEGFGAAIFNAAPLVHLLNELVLGILENLITLEGVEHCATVRVVVVAQMNVLPPVVLENALLGPRVVFAPHGVVALLVRAARFVKHPLERHSRQAPSRDDQRDRADGLARASQRGRGRGRATVSHLHRGALPACGGRAARDGGGPGLEARQRRGCPQTLHSGAREAGREARGRKGEGMGVLEEARGSEGSAGGEWTTSRHLKE